MGIRLDSKSVTGAYFRALVFAIFYIRQPLQLYLLLRLISFTTNGSKITSSQRVHNLIQVTVKVKIIVAVS